VLTVAEFNVATNRHLRRVLWVFRAICVLIIAVLIIFRYFLDPDEWFEANIHPDFPSWLVKWPGMVVLCALLLVIAWSLNRIARCDPRLVCPHCHRGLFRARLRVVATCKCPRCGCEMLTDPEPSRAATLARTDVEELRAKYRSEIRRISFGCLIAYLFLLVTAGGCVFLSCSESIPEEIIACIAEVAMVAWFARMGWLLICVFRLMRMGVHCARCRFLNEPNHATQFGRCGSCSQPLIAEPTIGVATPGPRA
jgi:hypothetical protein